jgi:hypothetical protein
MANNAQDNPALAMAYKYDRLDAGLLRAALDANERPRDRRAGGGCFTWTWTIALPSQRYAKRSLHRTHLHRLPLCRNQKRPNMTLREQGCNQDPVLRLERPVQKRRDSDL